MNICQELLPDQVMDPIQRVRNRRRKKKRRPPNKPHVGEQIESIELDRIVRTEPQDNKQRRTLLLHRSSDTQSWGFTLQSYGLHNKDKNEVEMLSYVDYVDIRSPAQLAGLRQGDVILSINGTNMEAYEHSELVGFIRTCDTTMRMVVLFENCVRKVELHLKYLKLQRLLTAKEFELRSLEQHEKSIKEGNNVDPRRLSLASYGSSVWNDNMSFLSLRPDLDVLPVTPANKDSKRSKHPSTNSLSMQWSPSILSLRSESKLPLHSGAPGGSLVNLRHSDSDRLSAVKSQRFEYSHSSLPSNVRLKVNQNGTGRRGGPAKEDRPYSMYATYQQGRKPFNNKARPRSLAVSAISEDGDYVQSFDSHSMCGSDISEASSLENSVFMNGQPNLTSTPVTPKSPLVENGSGSDLDLEYRLPPPGSTPKILHETPRSSSSSSQRSLSQRSVTSSDYSKKRVSKDKSKSKSKNSVKQYSQPSHAIIERLIQEPTEPVLLKFKPLATDFSSTVSLGGSNESSFDESGSVEESCSEHEQSFDGELPESRKLQDQEKSHHNHHYPPDIAWNPSCICGPTSPSGDNFRSPGAYSVDADYNSEASSPDLPVVVTSHNPIYQHHDLHQQLTNVKLYDGGVGTGDLSHSSSNGAIQFTVESDYYVSEGDEDTEEEGHDLSLGEEIFASLQDKGIGNLNFKNGDDFRGITLEYINEDDESTDL